VAEVLSAPDFSDACPFLAQPPERDDLDCADTVDSQPRPEDWCVVWQDLLVFDAVDWADG
jgi:hypothetical protein